MAIKKWDALLIPRMLPAKPSNEYISSDEDVAMDRVSPSEENHPSSFHW